VNAGLPEKMNCLLAIVMNGVVWVVHTGFIAEMHRLSSARMPSFPGTVQVLSLLRDHD